MDPWKWSTHMLLVVAGTLEHECEEGVGKILGCILLRELDEETMAQIAYCLDADVLAKIVDALSPSITTRLGADSRSQLQSLGPSPGVAMGRARLRTSPSGTMLAFPSFTPSLSLLLPLAPLPTPESAPDFDTLLEHELNRNLWAEPDSDAPVRPLGDGCAGRSGGRRARTRGGGSGGAKCEEPEQGALSPRHRFTRGYRRRQRYRIPHETCQMADVLPDTVVAHFGLKPGKFIGLRTRYRSPLRLA
jgi:hypothetical protein